MVDQDKLKGYVNDKLIFYGDKLWLLTREEQEIYEQENIYYKGWQTETGTSSLNEHAAGEIRFYTSLSNVLEKKAGHYNVGLLDAVNDLLQALGALEDGEVFYKEPKKMDTKSSVESVHDTYAWIDDIAERVTKKYETNKKEWVELNSGKLDLFAAIESAIQLKPNYFQIGMLDAINDTFKFLGIVEESEVFYLEFMGDQSTESKFDLKLKEFIIHNLKIEESTLLPNSLLKEERRGAIDFYSTLLELIENGHNDDKPHVTGMIDGINDFLQSIGVVEDATTFYSQMDPSQEHNDDSEKRKEIKILFSRLDAKKKVDQLIHDLVSNFTGSSRPTHVFEQSKLGFYVSLQNVLYRNERPYNKGFIDALNDILIFLGYVDKTEKFYEL